MSRIPKFRIWDGSQMHYGGFQLWFDEQGDLKEVVPFWEEETEILQCTGLKDRNGKDIYDGDIVRINHPHDRTGDFINAIGCVFWDDEEGGWYHSNNHGRPPKRMWGHAEVIGNFYQNPKLLEQ